MTILLANASACKDWKYRLPENRIMEIFTSCASIFSKVLLVLNAFDEATPELPEALIQKHLRHFAESNLQSVRSQHVDQIKAAFVPSRRLWISAKDDDIEMYQNGMKQTS